MDETTAFRDNEMISSPIAAYEQSNNPDNDTDKMKKPRAAIKDRSGNRYSEADFLGMSRTEQLSLARKWWMDSKGFDEAGLFQFSYTHFSDICKGLGFIKSVIDTGNASDDKKELSSDYDGSIIYIDHGKRGETIEKKITLDVSTNDKLNRLLDSTEHQLSNGERSKALDAILSAALDGLLSLKEQGKFGLAYRPLEEERLI